MIGMSFVSVILYGYIVYFFIFFNYTYTCMLFVIIFGFLIFPVKYIPRAQRIV